ncbi:pyridoxamine 5'-phosphate oxidase [Geodermatophilus sp. TF02-6]|uniref:pyridoxamine 5'-phosphate oxidase family protein n=1 Tax=Geodermatophilus sp. TF02-6 TaxID=2250575 RepID=UPI000DE9E44F|nr:pyridoxamine 5'-phosphate oxidase family protein [Geodermatophilus sp. TF02-6]RBY75503.1 pyridoxamine 5'-phosphate oxidase [Geodermatophilus sp. TF02-6]
MTTEDTRKVAELIKGERIGFLTTVTPQGKLTSRPMALQEVEFDGDLWFFAERTAPWLGHIATSPQVNVGIGSGGTWVSLTGMAAVVEDTAKKKELWNSAVEAWLPQGPEDPSVVLVEVDGDSAEYWDSPGNRLATAFSFVKAKATGQKPDTGEHQKVDL